MHPGWNPISLLTANAQERAPKKGKHVAVFVQPFLPSSNAQGLPELEVASLHLIGLLGFSSIFFHFPSPCLSPGKEFLSLNTCWVKKCLLLRWAFKTFSLIATRVGAVLELTTYPKILFLKCCCAPKALPICPKMMLRALLPVGFHSVILSCACYKHLY